MEFKIIEINLGGPSSTRTLVINEINSENECVRLPDFVNIGNYANTIRRLGYLEVQTKDTRSDYERWKDEYYYSYYPTPSIIETEVVVSPNVKKIFIPYCIEKISKLAFKNLKNVTFEIDEKNYNYKISDGKIVDKHSGEVIWSPND